MSQSHLKKLMSGREQPAEHTGIFQMLEKKPEDKQSPQCKVKKKQFLLLNFYLYAICIYIKVLKPSAWN